MSYPPYYPRRSSSMGCLGVFSVCCMLMFTLLNAALIWWFDPTWLGNWAFWKGKLVEREVVFVPSDQAPASEHITIAPPTPINPGKLQVLDRARAAVNYQPGSAASLQTDLGARVSVPAGAIGEATRISIAPIIELPRAMQRQGIIGQPYELRIGNHEHYRFHEPVEFAMPIAPGVKPNEVAVAVWENDRWAPVPTRFDAANNVATGQLPHASVIAGLSIGQVVIWPLVGVGVVGTTTQTGRHAAVHKWFQGDEFKFYRTESFCVHYATAGENAVVADSGYHRAGGRQPRSDGVPLVVADIADYMEQSRLAMEKNSIAFPKPSVGRYELILTKSGDFGASGIGGPMFISSTLAQMDAVDSGGDGGVMRGTVAHEMIHNAQDTWFSYLDGRRNPWWMETTGAYLGDWVWSQAGQPAGMVERAYQKKAETLKLPLTPMDLAEDPLHYAYSSFFNYLDRTGGGAGARIVKAVNEGKDPSLSALDRQCKSVLGIPLTQAFENWAIDFYHGDCWRGVTVPAAHRGVTPRYQATVQSSADEDFTVVRGAPLNATNAGLANDWAIFTPRTIKHLSAVYLPMLLESVPKSRKGKFFVSISGAKLSADLRLLVATDKLGTQRLPASGAPKGFAPFPISAERSQQVFKLDGEFDRVTLLMLNHSLETNLSPPQVERWLLLAPAFCNFERDAPKSSKWTVSWHRAELKSQVPIFDGYELVARKVGQPIEKATRVALTTEEFAQVTMPDDEDYIFNVRVQDKYQNWSEFSDSDQDDPFVGEWIGKIFLVDGSFAEPIVKWIETQRKKEKDKATARIATLKPEDQAAARSHLAKSDAEEQKITDFVSSLLRKGESLTRLGIPTRFRITRSNGQYKLMVLSFFWQKIEEKDVVPVELERVNSTKLTIRNKPPEMPAFYLELMRKGPSEIRNPEGWKVETNIEAEPVKFTLKWLFVRQEPQPPSQ